MRYDWRPITCTCGGRGRPVPTIRREKTVAEKLNEKIEEIRTSFDFFDKDHNGLIDFDEFRALLRTVNPEATTSQAAEGFSMTDTNCDGYVDGDEFVAWWQATWWEY
jgi:Ca2+-binding EF-hand superfamily protein